MTQTDDGTRSKTGRRTHTLFYAGPLLLWMVVIFIMSTRAGGSGTSITLLERMLVAYAPEVHFNHLQLDLLNYIFRKAGHLTEYSVLVLLAVRAFQVGRRELQLSSVAGALLLSGGYAACDELHQMFVPGRTPLINDVLLDCSGAALLLVLVVVWFGYKRMERRLFDSLEQ